VQDVVAQGHHLDLLFNGLRVVVEQGEARNADGGDRHEQGDDDAEADSQAGGYGQILHGLPIVGELFFEVWPGFHAFGRCRTI